MKTYPQPGTTKFTDWLPDAEARAIAHHHYHAEETRKTNDSSGKYHAVRTLSGWVALIGLINGVPCILHKWPDGRRELETLETADVL